MHAHAVHRDHLASVVALLATCPKRGLGRLVPDSWRPTGIANSEQRALAPVAWRHHWNEHRTGASAVTATGLSWAHAASVAAFDLGLLRERGR